MCIPLRYAHPICVLNRDIGRDKTERLEQEVSRCVNEVVFAGTGLLDASALETGGFDDSANPSAENSYLADRPSEDLAYSLPSMGGQEHRDASPMITVGGIPGQGSNPNSPGAGSHFMSPRSGEGGYPFATNDGPPGGSFSTFAVNPRGSEPQRSGIPDAPPSINVNFASSEFNPYGASPENRYAPPTGPPPHVADNPWDRPPQEPTGSYMAEEETSQSQHKAVHFKSPSPTSSFPEPTVPQGPLEVRNEGEAELWIRKHQEY